MTNYLPESDDDDDGEEQDYEGDAYDPGSGDGDEGTFKCPACSAEIYGGTVRCPKCGDYVTPGARSTAKGLPRWMWAVTVLLIVILIGGALRAC